MGAAGERGLVFKARDTWPRTAAVYCHPIHDWPDDAEVVERLPVRSGVRRGAAVDLVLARGRENRSQFVFTTARGRQVVFWQSPRTVKQSRLGIRRPTARAAGLAQLEILVDIRERYPYRFADQRVHVIRRALPAGDYATTVAEQIVACVERKSLADRVSSISGNRLKYQLADLAALPRAAIVMKDRYASVFKLDRIPPPSSPPSSPNCRSPGRPSQSYSPTLAPSPRSGPTGGWPPQPATPSTTPTPPPASPTCPHPPRSPPRRQAPHKSEPGPAPSDSTCPHAGGSHPTSGPPTKRNTPRRMLEPTTPAASGFSAYRGTARAASSSA